MDKFVVQLSRRYGALAERAIEYYARCRVYQALCNIVRLSRKDTSRRKRCLQILAWFTHGLPVADNWDPAQQTSRALTCF